MTKPTKEVEDLLRKNAELTLQHDQDVVLRKQDDDIIRGNMTKIRRLENEALIDSATIERMQVDIARNEELMG